MLSGLRSVRMLGFGNTFGYSNSFHSFLFCLPGRFVPMGRPLRFWTADANAAATTTTKTANEWICIEGVRWVEVGEMEDEWTGRAGC